MILSVTEDFRTRRSLSLNATPPAEPAPNQDHAPGCDRTKGDEWADDLWLVRARFGAWIDGVMGELRAGLQSAPGDDVRPGDVPGGEWARNVSPRFGDG